MGLFSSRHNVGPAYSPHKPWALAGYRAGGGRPKWIKFYESQGAAAAHLRAFIAAEDVDDRYVAVIHHLGGPRDLQKLSDRSMSRIEYERVAGAQQYVAQRRGYQANYSRGHRSRRHGNAELQTGKFYAYKGHRVWLDAVPGGYFAMVEGTAVQARATTQGEVMKKLRDKLDAGAANFARKGRRKARR